MRYAILFCSLLLLPGFLFALQDDPVETLIDLSQQPDVDTLSLSEVVPTLPNVEEDIQEVQSSGPSETRFIGRNFWGNVVGSGQGRSRSNRVLADSGILVLPGHTASVEAVRYNPHEKQLLSGGADGVAILWDTTSGQPIRRFESHRAPIAAVSFGSSPNKYITAGRDRRLLLWEMSSVNPTKEFIRLVSEPSALALNNAGILIVGLANGEITFYKFSDVQPYKVIRAHVLPLNSLAFNPKGDMIVSTGNDGTVSLWDTATGAGRGVLRGHRSAVLCAEFSPDGKYVVSGGTDKTVILWDVATGLEKVRFSGHTGDITGVFFSSDGSTIYTTGRDRSVIVWDVKTGQKLLQSEKRNSPIEMAAIEVTTGNVALAEQNGMIEILTPVSLKPVQPIGEVETNSLAQLPSSVGIQDQQNKVESLEEEQKATVNTGGNATAFPNHIPRARQLFRIGKTNTYSEQGSLNRDGKLLLTLSTQTGETILWNTVNGREIQRLGGGNLLSRIILHPTELVAFSGSKTGSIQFWDMVYYKITRTVPAHTSSVSALAVSPDGSQLCSAAVDGSVILWDTNTQTSVQSHSFSKEVTSLCFSPDQQSVVLGMGDGNIIRWKPSDDSLSPFENAKGGAVSLAFFPKGDRVVSGNRNGMLTIWDLETGQSLSSISTQQQGVRSVAISPNARLVATGGEDGQTVLWNMDTLTPQLIVPFQGGAVTTVLFNPAELELITVGGRTPILWNIEDVSR
ncbi:MAG: WD40 repeat domain-containing protein [Thermoguttaceae bacterium]